MDVPEPATLEPFLHPSAWRASDMADPLRYTIHLDEGDVAEIDAALGTARAAGRTIPELDRQDFALDRVRTKLADMLDRLENGAGLVLLRGLPR